MPILNLQYNSLINSRAICINNQQLSTYFLTIENLTYKSINYSLLLGYQGFSLVLNLIIELFLLMVLLTLHLVLGFLQNTQKKTNKIQIRKIL